MATFVLSKYKPEETEVKEEVVEPAEKPSDIIQNKDVDKILLKVDGSLSEIVAKSLYEALKKKVNIVEMDDKKVSVTDPVKTENNAKAITQESINESPVDTLNSIPKGSIVYIANEGFRTKKEEWFLTSMENRGCKVFYTLPSLTRHIENHFSSESLSEIESVSEEIKAQLEGEAVTADDVSEQTEEEKSLSDANPETEEVSTESITEDLDDGLLLSDYLRSLDDEERKAWITERYRDDNLTDDVYEQVLDRMLADSERWLSSVTSITTKYQIRSKGNYHVSGVVIEKDITNMTSDEMVDVWTNDFASKLGTPKEQPNE